MKIKPEREVIEQWLEQRNPRESALVFLVGLGAVYLLWNLFFEVPLRHQRDNLQLSIDETRKQLETETQNLQTVRQVITSASFTRNLQKQQLLNSQANQTGERLRGISQTFVPFDALAQVTNDVIAQQEEVMLVSMKAFSPEPWLQAQGLPGTLYNLQNVYKYEMELEFRGTYFNVLAFLGHLEKLPWHLYWDQLSYQVLQYPEAKVVARFYVLSDQKG